MTLFNMACPNVIFADALRKYYNGKEDERTLMMLEENTGESLVSGGIIGAIIGDIVGAFYEFNNCKSTETPLFPYGANFTDDTVMTVAVADWLLNGVPLKKTMTDWGNEYPNRGYGGMFYEWLFYSKDKEPYNSFGKVVFQTVCLG